MNFISFYTEIDYCHVIKNDFSSANETLVEEVNLNILSFIYIHIHICKVKRLIHLSNSMSILFISFLFSFITCTV